MARCLKTCYNNNEQKSLRNTFLESVWKKIILALLGRPSPVVLFYDSACSFCVQSSVTQEPCDKKVEKILYYSNKRWLAQCYPMMWIYIFLIQALCFQFLYPALFILWKVKNVFCTYIHQKRPCMYEVNILVFTIISNLELSTTIIDLNQSQKLFVYTSTYTRYIYVYKEKLYGHDASSLFPTNHIMKYASDLNIFLNVIKKI